MGIGVRWHERRVQPSEFNPQMCSTPASGGGGKWVGRRVKPQNLSQVGVNNIGVLLALVDSKCVPCLSYGLCAVSLKHYETAMVDNCFDIILAKVFGTFNKHILRNCLYYAGYLPLSFKLDLEKIKYLLNASKLLSVNVDLFYFHKLFGDCEKMELFKKYDILCSDSASVGRLKVYSRFESSVIQ